MRITVATLLASTVAVATGQAQVPPPIVTDGLAAMAEQGPALAVETWFRGSRHENNLGTKQTFIEQFEIFAQAAGAVLGHDIIHVQQLGPNYSITYALIRYENDPLFIAVEVYNGSGGWRLMNIEFNDQVAEVFPAGVLEPQN